LFVFKILASGAEFQNTGFLPASAKLAVKYRPGRWNTGRLATLLWDWIWDPVSLGGKLADIFLVR